MKKNILVFGLISGAISAFLMAATVPFADRIGFDKAMVIGYTAIVASFLMVYFGIRSYRDNAGQGQITFGKAFTVGIGITLISCIFYVVTWEIIYFNFLPGFMDKYSDYVIGKAKAAGASPEILQAKLVEMQNNKALYDQPLLNAAMTFLEPFPVGLAITLISAALLRTKPRQKQPHSPLPAS